MSDNVLVVAEHFRGALDDVTFELLAMARPLAQQLGGEIEVALIGGSGSMVGELGAAKTVVRIDGKELESFNPESHAIALAAIFAARQPRVVITAYTSMGMDLSSTLAVRAGLPLATFCISVEGGERIGATSQLYGGKMNVTADLGPGPCIVSVLAGAAAADEGRENGTPEQISLPLPELPQRVRFRRLIEPEAGDVDITAQEVLVAIGRGIGSQDDVEVAEELAEALGAAVAGSRPLIDAGWLPKTRQVGKSGLKVSPKVYLALGISGAPEHLEGMKSSGTIVAVNTDERAPIFGVAHYGLVADLFDVCEELTEKLGEKQGA